MIVGLRATTAFIRLKRGEIYRHPDEFLGHHAITLVGYDERQQAFKLINSWGQGWADSGFGWIDYDTLSAEAEPRAGYLMRIVVAPTPVPAPPPTLVVTPTPPPPPRSVPTVTPIPAPPTLRPTPIISPAPTTSTAAWSSTGAFSHRSDTISRIS